MKRFSLMLLMLAAITFLPTFSATTNAGIVGVTSPTFLAPNPGVTGTYFGYEFKQHGAYINEWARDYFLQCVLDHMNNKWGYVVMDVRTWDEGYTDMSTGEYIPNSWRFEVTIIVTAESPFYFDPAEVLDPTHPDYFDPFWPDAPMPGL